MNNIPCNPDHNGECLVCDAWPSNCAYQRYLKHDYSVETKEELETMFNKYKMNKTQIDTLPDQPLSDLENLEYLYTMYKRTVERGKPNQRKAEQLKTYIDIIQVKTLMDEQPR